MMLANELLPALIKYVHSRPVRETLNLRDDEIPTLTFLAQGEYNINYRLNAGHNYVVRVNTGTQIGKPGGEQVAYEAAALRLLDSHNVAPKLIFLDDTLTRFPYGLLIMEYLPGGPLEYGNVSHIVSAAQTLARLHVISVPNDAPFIRRRPLIDDIEEARGWLAPYFACDRAPRAVKAILHERLAAAENAAARYACHFPAPTHLVHTDVQAHNFLVFEDDCRLVDWERPLIDDPTYDLAHFLIPTTTRWKSDYVFSPLEEQAFLTAYLAARPDQRGDDLRNRLQIRRPFILLRAVSWCAGAWVEYTQGHRAIAHSDTLAKIEDYLQPATLQIYFDD